MKRQRLQWFGGLFYPACHCEASFVIIGDMGDSGGKAYFTQLSQWNSNSSRAVFDLMFLSFLEIVTSETVEDLPYKAWYRSHMASLQAMMVCTCRASWRGATDSGNAYEMERLSWLLMPSLVLFRMRNPIGESGRSAGRDSPSREEF